MSFQEKSAWGMLVGIFVVSLFYFPAAFRVVEAANEPIALIALIVVGTIALVVIEVLYHTVIAVSAPREANRTDERDQLIDLKSERNSSFLLGFSLFTLIGWILLANAVQSESAPGPLGIVVYIMLAISVAEMIKLASQIWYYRVGVQ